MHLIALDLDGTIEDSRADMIAAVQRVRRGRNLPPRPDGDFLPHVQRSMPHLLEACFAEQLALVGARGRQRALAELEAAYETEYLAHIADRTRLYPGMDAALTELAHLGHLAVVTGKPTRLARALLSALGVLRYITAVIGGDACAESKPSPAPLIAAAGACGIGARGEGTGRAVMIGDSATDVRCGRAFGATVIWCAWGYHDEPGGERADFTARRPDELPGLARRALGLDSGPDDGSAVA